jgi:sialic acid synthase SpsE
MQCTSVYPCPYEISNIGVITKYLNKFNLITGLSDHTNSIYTSIGAVALGARIIEKHFTLDKNMKGPDHASSIDPKELKDLVEGCNAVFDARSSEKKIHKKEKEIISWARESVVSIKKILKDEKLTYNNISVKRPAPTKNEIEAKYFKNTLGKFSKKKIKANIKIKWSEITK